MKKILLPLLLVFITGITGLHAQPSFALRVVKDNLFIPWEIIYGPDNHIWFTQKNGYVCRLDPENGQLDTIYHEPQTVIRNEGGMLGMVLHPDFANDPYVFIAYEYESGGNYIERVVRYTYANGILQSPMTLIDNIAGNNIHNGCRLAIEGDKLFITTGDAGNTAFSGNITSLNGKVLRINLDGTIPADNPVPDNPVWSLGHRNAQGLVFHNGILYSSEHGPNNDDEVNIILKGRHYGWPFVAGFCDLPAEMDVCADYEVVEPMYAWTPTLAVSGIDYYNHPMFPEWANSLLMTTLKDNNLYHVSLNTAGDSVTGVTAIAGIDYGRLRDIAVAPDGRIFLSTSNSNAGGNGTPSDKIIELYDSSATGLWTIHPDDNNLLVYPNPATDIMTVAFTVQGMDQQAWRYSITSLQGQVIEEDHLEYSRLHVGQLSPGIYFLKVWNGKQQTMFRRFVKW